MLFMIDMHYVLQRQFLVFFLLLAINLIEFFSGLIFLVVFQLNAHTLNILVLNNLTFQLSAVVEDASSGGLFPFFFFL